MADIVEHQDEADPAGRISAALAVLGTVAAGEIDARDAEISRLRSELEQVKRQAYACASDLEDAHASLEAVKRDRHMLAESQEAAEASLAKLKDRALEVVGPFAETYERCRPDTDAIIRGKALDLDASPDDALAMTFQTLGHLRAARAFEKELKDG